MERPIAVIGAGNSGFAMAAHLLSAGHTVHMWNRSEEDLFTPVRQAGGITTSGKVNGCFMPNLMTHDMAEAIRDAELILVTVPANAHAPVAKAMVPHLRDGQVIVLTPGRTCGAPEVHHLLHAHGVETNITIAETQTIIYTCRKDTPSSVVILAFKNGVLLSALKPSQTEAVLQILPKCIRRFFAPASSLLQTSLGNVGMILHCAPVLLNIGWIESPQTRFKYYYEGITPSIASFLEKLDAERLEVADRCGIHTLSVADWMRHSYDISGRSLYECIQANSSYAKIDAPRTLKHRYMYEDVPTGLVPLEAIGKALGLPMPLTESIIDLANRIVEEDFRRIGRNAGVLGLTRGLPAQEVVAIIAGQR